MAGDPDKAKLIAELAAAREQLAEAGHALEQKGAEFKKTLDVPKRIAASYRSHKPAWLAGAALLGLLLSRIPARKKVVYVERSTGETLGPAGKAGKTWGLLKFFAGLARPWLLSAAEQHLQNLAQRMATPPPPPPPRGRTSGPPRN
jgi:hypothetical protein